jgi:hypothetical protein
MNNLWVILGWRENFMQDKKTVFIETTTLLDQVVLIGYI